MLIMGLDLSLTGTGIVVLDNGNIMENFLVKSKPSDKSPTGELIRILKIVEHIPTTVNFAVIEGLAFMAKNTTALCQLSGLNYLVRKKLYECNIPFIIVAPTTLKKFITGKGNGEKSLIMLEIFKRYNVSIDNDNQADAYVLAKIGEAYQGENAEELTKPQEEVIKLLKNNL